MPGTVVRDATAVDLAVGATLNAAGTTNGTVNDLQYPCWFTASLDTATVTGTTPTIMFSVQAADNLAFNSGVVTLGTSSVTSGTGAAQSNVDGLRQVKCYTNKRYVRATGVVLGGTSPVYTGSKIRIVPVYDRHTTLSTA